MTGAVESLAMWVDAEPAEVRSMLEAGQASRFFKRTDQSAPHPLAPKYPVPEAGVMLDDPVIALRNWSYAEEDNGEDRVAEQEDEQRGHTPEEILEHAEETRAMHNAESMCRKYVDGEPCVMGAGHGSDCTGRCYGRPHGLPCAMAAGHGGDHTPMEVDDGAGRGPGRPRSRDAEETETAQAEEKRTLSGPEALVAAMAMREQFTLID
jgi:hypothetical protein